MEKFGQSLRDTERRSTRKTLISSPEKTVEQSWGVIFHHFLPFFNASGEACRSQDFRSTEVM
jgi:hypothetical protein